MSTKLVTYRGRPAVIPAKYSSYEEAMVANAPRVQLLASHSKPAEFSLNGFGGADNSDYLGERDNAVRIARYRTERALS